MGCDYVTLIEVVFRLNVKYSEINIKTKYSTL